MSFRVNGINGICHHAYDNPDVICFRDVVDDAHVSYWYEWQGINQDISMREFFEEVKKCNLSPDKLSIRAYEDGNGVIIDYKPCPFCGGKAKIMVVQELRIGGDEGYVIQCENCYMNTASINGTYSFSSEDAIELWNRRK